MSSTLAGGFLSTAPPNSWGLRNVYLVYLADLFLIYLKYLKDLMISLSLLDSKGGPRHIIDSSNVTDEPLLKMLLTKVPSFISKIV